MHQLADYYPNKFSKINNSVTFLIGNTFANLRGLGRTLSYLWFTYFCPQQKKSFCLRAVNCSPHTASLWTCSYSSRHTWSGLHLILNTLNSHSAWFRCITSQHIQTSATVNLWGNHVFVFVFLSWNEIDLIGNLRFLNLDVKQRQSLSHAQTLMV